MPETTGRPARAADGRIRLLASTYGGIARRYDALESLLRREHELLAEGGATSEVHEILRRKRELIARIRTDQESVGKTKAWAARTHHPLPRAETRALLDLLDAVSRRIERALALEADCRALLARAAVVRASEVLPAFAGGTSAKDAPSTERSGSR